MSDITSVLFGHGERRAPVAPPTIVEGVIRSASLTDGITFTVPSWDQGHHMFGPAPWNRSMVEVASAHDHLGTVPPVGSRCLVVFVGPGISNPWIVGWW